MVSSGPAQLVTDFIFIRTQGRLGRNPRPFAIAGIFLFYPFLSRSTQTGGCGGLRAACRYLRASSWPGLVRIFPSSLPCPAAPSDITAWFSVWEPPGKQSPRAPPLSSWDRHITKMLSGSRRELCFQTNADTMEMSKTCQKTSWGSSTAFFSGPEVILNMCVWHPSCVRTTAVNRDIKFDFEGSSVLGGLLGSRWTHALHASQALRKGWETLMWGRKELEGVCLPFVFENETHSFWCWIFASSS